MRCYCNVHQPGDRTIAKFHKKSKNIAQKIAGLGGTQFSQEVVPSNIDRHRQDRYTAQKTDITEKVHKRPVQRYHQTIHPKMPKLANFARKLQTTKIRHV